MFKIIVRQIPTKLDNRNSKKHSQIGKIVVLCKSYFVEIGKGLTCHDAFHKIGTRGIMVLYLTGTSVRIFKKGVFVVEVVYSDSLPFGVEIVIDNLLIIGTQKQALIKKEPA